MNRFGWLSAIGLILLSNVWVIAGVAYNRSGEPEATILLTERELPKAYQSRENTGLFLRLNWSMPGFQKPDRYEIAPSWFNREKLEALGFRTEVPVSSTNAYDYYRHQLPRPAYIVLEMEGPAWENWKNKAIEYLQKLNSDLQQTDDPEKKKTFALQIEDMKRRMVMQTRLFAVDGGPDAQALRAKYPDRNRYLIAQGIVRIRLDYPYSKDAKTGRARQPVLNGYIQQISVNTLHLPHMFREAYLQIISENRYISFSGEEGATKKAVAPRYAVIVNYGKKYEPWVADLKALK